FVDAGDAADSPGALSPSFGYGVGARFRSPVGPINLDLAYGEATDEFRLHFSLGVSF
ncbi:MAG: BamA/TamA family outer membrane protein, partial [Thiobacillus sp.]|nr:BamA/TamA family outer membrane protein [Thiobacillus sp.]